MRHKKGLELQASFIVILTLSVAMMVIGMQFATRFFDKADTMRLHLDDATDQRIEALLDDGSKVAIPLNKKEVPKGESVTFGMGINNVLTIRESDENNNFQIQIGGATRYPDATCTTNFGAIRLATQAGNIDAQTGVKFTDSVRKNTKKKYLIGVQMPKTADRCTYVFDVIVEYEDETGTYQTYADSTYKLYVSVI